MILLLYKAYDMGKAVLTDIGTEELAHLEIVAAIIHQLTKDLTPEEIALAETATAATESIHRETGEEGFSLENILSDTDSEDRIVEKLALNQAISKLPEREALVIKLRYFHALTQQRVAAVLDVSQVQVSRIEKKALQHLRELLV